MHARALTTVGVIIALASPAGAAAKLIPTNHPAPHAAKQVGKAHRVPRVLCICVKIPVSGLPAQSEVELEAQSDIDLLAHGLEPGYASFQTTVELQAAYDAVLVANGLNPYFKTAGA
jgi:hypothetical protein